MLRLIRGSKECVRSRSVRAGTATLLALGAIATTQTAAQAESAAPKLTYSIQTPYDQMDISVNGVYAGLALWSKDPGGDANGDGVSDPGDALIAFDAAADGYGVEARLSTGRIASTAGHASPYWSAWETGNLPEGNAYTMKVCVVKGDWESCSPPRTVYA